MTLDRIVIRRCFDTHLHLRDAELLRFVLPYTLRWCQAAVVKPNLLPPVANADDALAYRGRIRNASNGTYFMPHMSIQLMETTSAGTVQAAIDSGFRRFKIYPRNQTHNSQFGVLDYRKLYPVFETIQSYNRRGIRVVVCFHGEKPGTDIMDAEALFLGLLLQIVRDFPHMPIVLEHLSSAAGADCVFSGPKNLAGGITAHHPVLTLNDILVGGLQPHHYCMPPAKKGSDRDAVRAAMLSGSPKFFLGTDSAPHLRSKKECNHGCAGIFTAMTGLQVITDIFDQAGLRDRLQDFTSTFGAEFHGVSLTDETVTLERRPWRVPETIGPVEGDVIVPFRAGHELAWDIAA